MCPFSLTAPSTPSLIVSALPCFPWSQLPSSPAQLLCWPLNGCPCPCSCSLKSNFDMTVRRMLLEPKAGHSPACSRPPIHVHLTENTTQNPGPGHKAPHDLTPVLLVSSLFTPQLCPLPLIGILSVPTHRAHF